MRRPAIAGLVASLALAACGIAAGRAADAPAVIEGRITAERLDRQLPAVLLSATAIEFRSSSGGVFEPWAGYVIRARRIATRVAPGHRINSATALYWAAGRVRVMGGEACFHRSRCNDNYRSCTAADLAESALTTAAYLRQLGYSEGFIARALERSGSDVWCPTAADWRAEGVIVEGAP